MELNGILLVWYKLKLETETTQAEHGICSFWRCDKTIATQHGQKLPNIQEVPNHVWPMLFRRQNHQKGNHWNLKPAPCDMKKMLITPKPPILGVSLLFSDSCSSTNRFHPTPFTIHRMCLPWLDVYNVTTLPLLDVKVGNRFRKPVPLQVPFQVLVSLFATYSFCIAATEVKTTSMFYINKMDNGSKQNQP